MVAEENVAKQLQIVVYTTTLEIKRKDVRTEVSIKWCKLKKKKSCTELREGLGQAVGVREDL